MSKYYIGTMCGTSLDSFDISIASFTNNKTRVLGFKSFKLGSSLKKEIQKCKFVPKKYKAHTKANELLNKKVISSIKKTLSHYKIDKNDIAGIGFPGITLEHKPKNKKSTYLGDPSTIASKTSIAVIADFRQTDINAGGQGAPLSAFFHIFLNQNRKDFITFINLGGFANITLQCGKKILAFDTGVANYLIDLWCQKKFNKKYDFGGKLALKGSVHPKLLQKLLDDKYFETGPPKSTGFEYFNWEWLKKHLQKFKKINRFDVLSTLSYFTIITVINEINRYQPKSKHLYIGGGGANNKLLVQGILTLTGKTRYLNIGSKISEKNLESLAFAWLSMMRMESHKITNTSITGAKKSRLLGTIYR